MKTDPPFIRFHQHTVQHQLSGPRFLVGNDLPLRTPCQRTCGDNQPRDLLGQRRRPRLKTVLARQCGIALPDVHLFGIQCSSQLPHATGQKLGVLALRLSQ